jgi:ABC-type glutathione transport system ATPase component
VTEPVLVAEDVVVDFALRRGRTIRAVDGVSFALRPGEVLGVVGESGSGKTTLGRVVAGFLHPTSGRVRYRTDPDGPVPRGGRPARGRRDVPMIFQESAMALSPRLPVWRTVGEALRPNLVTFPATGRRRVSELREQVAPHLERAGLAAAAVLDKRAGELSGGEKQRVAIARALAASPVAMVCDESVSALDVSVRAVVLNLFRRLSREQGIALLFITHDISVVAHLADRTMVMYRGQVVDSGPSRELVDHPRADYTRRLIAAVPSLDRA